jgi:hypothetical protein
MSGMFCNDCGYNKLDLDCICPGAPKKAIKYQTRVVDRTPNELQYAISDIQHRGFEITNIIQNDEVVTIIFRNR